MTLNDDEIEDYGPPGSGYNDGSGACVRVRSSKCARHFVAQCCRMLLTVVNLMLLVRKHTGAVLTKYNRIITHLTA